MISFFEGEKVVYEARKHTIVLINKYIVIAVLMLLPLLLIVVAPYSPVKFVVEGNVGVLLTLMYVCWLAILWVTIFYIWTTFYLNVWIVTDRRLIIIEQEGLFSRNVEEVEISKIEDVSANMDGIMASMCNFGTVKVETASETGKFVFDMVRAPNALREALLGVHLDASARLQNKLTID